MARCVTLCADDFAQSPLVDRAITELVARGRLTATSVFSLSPYWRNSATELKIYRDQIDVGLHFSLTEPFDAVTKPLVYWLVFSQVGMLPLAKVSHSLITQLDRFTDEWGALPAHIDGHQHVHALPGIRHILTTTIAKYWPQGNYPYVRTPDRLAHWGDATVKANLLKMCCRGFGRHIAAHGIATHRWFGGLYSFSPNSPYRALMRQWLTSCEEGGLIMCHPGRPGYAPADPIQQTRSQEYQYLSSTAFLEDLAWANVRLARVAGPRAPYPSANPRQRQSHK